MISTSTRQLWQEWIKVTRMRCHLHFEIEQDDLGKHIAICREVGRRYAQRIAGDMPQQPRRVVEVGSSVGFNCLALGERNPEAEVIGLEPDGEACAVGNAMAGDFKLTNTRFLQGVGEHLPFPDQSVDWIICHTVIEHVNDVDACIAEMARVLRPGGCLHLEAPNYLWPWEPHLRIVMPPLCPKPLMRLLARLQGAGKNVDYAAHLKLVHPGWLERAMRRNGLRWINRVEEKFHQAATGKHDHIVAHGRAARLLGVLQRIGLAKAAISILLTLGLYPSLLYTARKPNDPPD